MANLRDPKILAESIKQSEKKMLKFRESRAKHLRDFVGNMYSKSSDDVDHVSTTRPHPLNLTYKSCTTLIPNLVYNNPECSISSQIIAYKEYAGILELGVNHLLREIKYRQTLRLVIMDAILLAGFTKRGLAVSSQTIDLDGAQVDVGQPYVDRVDPDDMIIDPLARCWEEQRFCGNKFRVDKDWMMENAEFFGMDTDKLNNAIDSAKDRSQKAENLSMEGSNKIMSTKSQGLITLAEIYLPQYETIITVPWGDDGDIGNTILRETPYEGPEEGPYGMLGFAFAPNNLMPVAPANSWRGLMEAANQMLTKTIGQAARQKRILAYSSDGDDVAERIRDASDGEGILVPDVNAVKDLDFGGAPGENYHATDYIKTLYAEDAMNLEMLSGTGTNEPTATQSSIIDKNLSIRLDDMRGLVQDFVADDMKHLAFFLHTDPLIELPLAKRVQGVDMQVMYTPEMREGDWLDFAIKVVPYSMVRQTPDMKARRLVEFCGNIIPMLAQVQQQLGPAFNMEAAIKIIGKNMGIDDLTEIINSQELQKMEGILMGLIDQGTGGGGPPLKPAAMTQQQPGQGHMPAVRPQQPNPWGTVKEGQTAESQQRQANHEAEGDLQAANLQ